MLLHICSITLTVQSFRTDAIFILNIPKENNSEKMVELWFLFSSYCPMKLYICSKFHENIDARFKVIEWKRFETNNKKRSRNYGSYSLHVVWCCFIFVPSFVKISLTVLKL